MERDIDGEVSQPDRPIDREPDRSQGYDRHKEGRMENNLARFMGGSPLAVLGRLILLSILVGVVLHALGLDPLHIWRSLRDLVQQLWDMGFDLFRWLWRYFLLGAAIVIPLWLIARLVKAPSKRA